MRRHDPAGHTGFRPLLVLLLAVAFLACGGDDDNPATPVVPTGRLSAKINGTTWTSSVAVATPANFGASFLSIAAYGPSGGDSLYLNIGLSEPGVKTFALGGTTNLTVAGILLGTTGAYQNWTTINATSTGTVTVQSLTADRVVGTFGFKAFSVQSQSNIDVTEGSFDIPVLAVPVP